MTTTTGRKVRGDAKLEQLNAEQQERLHGWFEENCTYDEVVRLVKQQFGISVGKSAVGVYWRRHILPEREDDEAEIVATLPKVSAEDFDAATLQHVRVLAWSAVARPLPDVDRAAKLLAVVGKSERQALAVRRVELAERRVVVQEEMARLRRERFESGRNAEREHERSDGVKGDTKVYPPSPRSRSSLPESAVAAGSGEAAEVAAKAEGGKLEKREIGNGENGSGVKIAEPKLPRFPGYSGLGRTEGEGLGEHRTSHIEHRTSKDGEGDADAASGSEVTGRGGRAEMAAKTQHGEGTSKGPDEAGLPVAVTATVSAPAIVPGASAPMGSGESGQVAGARDLQTGASPSTPNAVPGAKAAPFDEGMFSLAEVIRRHNQRLRERAQSAKAPQEQW